MSGAEASLVIGLISGIISIIGATKTVYDAVEDKTGLPEAFRQEATQIYIEKHPASANSGGLQLIIKACETRANQLKEIFHKVAPLGEDSRADRYLKAVRTMGKGARVESLIKGILEDLQLLVGNHLVNMTSGEHIKDLATTIKEISSIEPSIPEGEFPDSGNVFNQYGSGHMFNATGGKNL